MFKNTNSKRTMFILLALVLVTSLFIGGSIARYITNTSSKDSARVAIWGINTGGEDMDLFKNSYKLTEDGDIIAKSNDEVDIIAPGTSGVSEFKIVEAMAGIKPEVMYEILISLDDSEIDDAIKNHPGILWSVDGGTWGTWEEFKTSLLSLSGDPSGFKVYEPGDVHDNFLNNATHTVAWKWLLDSGYDVEDTEMGNLAAKENGDIVANLSIKITARQTDGSSIGMLDTTDVFNLNDTGAVLSFRSIAPKSELQSVKVDDTTVNPDNYEVEEGSTIIIFNDDYAKSLSVGNHKVEIISQNFTAKTEFKVENGGFSHSNKIPEGGTYYVKVPINPDVGYICVGDYEGAESILTAGQSFPETVNDGDVYVYGDYEYRYNLTGWQTDPWGERTKQFEGWGVKVLNRNQETYGEILTSINGKNITDMETTFFFITSLIEAPEIPKTVISMSNTFVGCTNLEKATTIPESVIYMDYTFYDCTSLTEAPIISNGVKDMNSAFRGTALVKPPIIPNTVTDMSNTFYNCTSLEEMPIIPNGVKNMSNTFNNCVSLEKTSTIPESVTNMSFTFMDCKKLTGILEINATPNTYENCFMNTKESITLIGESSILSEIAATAISISTGEPIGNVIVGN